MINLISILYVRSSLLEDYWDEYMEYLGEDNNKSVANKEMKSKSNRLYKTLFSLLEVTLLEVTWAPGDEQFCFTDFGLQVAPFLKKKLEFSHSPDVNISKDSSTEYSWST